MVLPNPIYNFSAGPAALPETVLRTAQNEMLNYNGSGLPIMSIYHRSDIFLNILNHAEQNLRKLLNIPANYKILFLQGGASVQFSMVAMNLSKGFKYIDSVVSGHWSSVAHKQMGRLSEAEIRLAASGEPFHYLNLPPPTDWNIHNRSAFVHFVSNETANGLQYNTIPKLEHNIPPLVCDMSSDILSRCINVEDFGVIYASAQKNIGPAGVTVLIIREDLLERCSDSIPDVWNYQTHLNKQGMYNTPATYSIYIAGLVFNWLFSQGGIAGIEAINKIKAAKLYQAIDNSGGFYNNGIHPDARSKMNIVFSTGKYELDKLFINEADSHGLKLLQGYRTVGGMRASIYNAMPLHGVEALISFMQYFQQRYG